MEIPEGLEGVPEGHCCKLIKALYGLKQAGRQWYQKLSETMTEFKAKRVPSDPHTFMVTKVIDKVKRTLILPVYVDDLFPFGDKVLTDDFEKWIPEYFNTSTPCDAHYLLGIRITRERNPWFPQQPWISLDQINFIENTISSISLAYKTEITQRTTVLPAAEIIPHTLPKILADHKRVRKFQSAVGQLMYIMLATRPDIAYLVGMLARHASNPSPDHEKALLHLVGYLLRTKNTVITYYKEDDPNLHQGILDVYTDADWAGETHSARSTLGMVIKKNGSAISWLSKRQGCVSTSTMESEYIAMFEASRNAVFLTLLEEQFGLDYFGPNIWCDNQAAISIATGSDLDFKRSRFMNIKYHWVRRAEKKDQIDVKYIKSADNLTDLFTKRLPAGSLSTLRGKFMNTTEVRDTIGVDRTNFSENVSDNK